MKDFIKVVLSIIAIWSPVFVVDFLFGTPSGIVKGLVVLHIFVAGFFSMLIIYGKQLGEDLEKTNNKD